MNIELFVRYIIELSLFVPAGIMAVIPVRNFQRVKTSYMIILFTVLMIMAVFGGAAVCSIYDLSTNIILLFFCRYFSLLIISVMTFPCQKSCFAF